MSHIMPQTHTNDSLAASLLHTVQLTLTLFVNFGKRIFRRSKFSLLCNTGQTITAPYFYCIHENNVLYTSRAVQLSTVWRTAIFLFSSLFFRPTARVHYSKHGLKAFQFSLTFPLDFKPKLAVKEN